MTKKLVVFATAVMTTLLALVLLWQFRIVVIYLIVSFALAATVRPLIIDWSRRSIVMRLLLILLYLISLGGFGYLISLVGRLVIGDIQQLAQMLSAQDAWRMPPWLEGSLFDQALVARLPPPSKLFEAVTGDHGQFVLPAILGFTQGIGGVVSGVIVILFLSIYWSINQIHFERLWLSLLPSELRKQARDIWKTIEPVLGAYIRGEVAQSLLVGLLLVVGYWLLGSQYPTLLALIGMLAWLIPVVGAFLAVILPLLIGLLTSVQLGLLTVFYTLIVVIILKVWVKPRLYNRDWENPVLTLVILLALADAFGIVGIIIAPPLSVVCQILWRRLVSDRLASGAASQVSDLKERQARLSAVIKEMDELPPPLVISSMERLTDLMGKAEPILQAALPAEPSDPFYPPRSFKSEDGSSLSKS
ncbi:MAG: AI-2E family transporter [Anaerolineales bacterium]|nr:MAG: AI-2E family transporter [Anaerolineales bacterium]